MGPFGSGKSSVAAMKLYKTGLFQEADPALSQIRPIRSVRTAVVRNTYRELKMTTWRTIDHWLPEGAFGTMHWADFSYQIDLNLDDGTRYQHEMLFLALDKPKDVSKLLSLELTHAFINEAREVPLAVVEPLLGRIDRWPSRDSGVGPTFTSIQFDTNPPDEESWIYDFAEISKPESFKLYKQPGGESPGAENLEHLGPRYYKRLREYNTPDWCKVHVDGEYGFIQDGKAVYPEYSDLVMAQEFDLLPPSDCPVLTIGLDFGLTPGASLQQRTPLGQLRIVDEIVSDRMGAKQLAEPLRQLMAKYPGYEFKIGGDPSGDHSEQSDEEQTAFRMLRTEGIIAHPVRTLSGGDNNPDIRIQALRDPMKRMIDGQPGLLVHPRCLKTRRALGGKYQYKRINATGDFKYHLKPDKNDASHIAEAGQYGAMVSGENPLVSFDAVPLTPTQMSVDFNPYDA